MKNYNVYEKSAVQIHGGIFKMSTMKEKHTFVICAYKESAYLEECVKSLKEQKKESNIMYDGTRRRQCCGNVQPKT